MRPHRAGLAALLAGAGLAAACGGPAPVETRYLDLVASGHAGTPATVSCADETYTALTFETDRRLAVPATFGPGARLEIAGCMPQARRAVREGGEGSIALVAEAEPGGEPPPVRFTVPLTARTGWWRTEVDLSSLAATTGRLRLDVILPRGATLHLRDLRLSSSSAADRRRPRGLQVLLISVDTLREDSLGALGGKVQTPHLDRLAAEAEVFRPHYAAASWTRPSHAALLTGVDAEIHGAAATGGRLHPGVPTLAERLAAAGLRTAALVHDCQWLEPELGFSRGFGEYRVEPWRIGRGIRQVADWMSEHRGEPFFFFFHTFEPHSDTFRLPYESPGTRQRTVRQRFGVEDYGCRRKACASQLLRRLHQGRIEPLAGEGEILRFLYDRGVEEVDRQLGFLFEHLRRLGVWEEMLVVVTSDHGESFFEHDQLLHGTPWEDVLRVPLLIKWPGGRRAGERRETPTSALDVTPTLLAAAGLDRAELAGPGLPGHDLAAGPAPVPVFSGTNFRAVVAGGWKGVFEHEWGEDLLYDLRADPWGRHDVGGERPAELERLRRLVEERRRANRRLLESLGDPAAEAPPRPSPEELERLRALGYVD